MNNTLYNCTHWRTGKQFDISLVFLVACWAQLSCFIPPPVSAGVVSAEWTPASHTAINTVQDKPSAGQKVSARQAQTAANQAKQTAIEVKIKNIRQNMLQLAKKLVKDFPHNEEPFTLLGIVYRRLGKNDEALKAWQQGLAINPEQPDVLNNMAWIALEREEFPQALKLWHQALELKPDMSGLHLAIARVYIAQGQYDNGIRELEEEIKLHPQSPFCYYLLGQAYQLQEKYASAKQYFEKAIQSNPDNANAYYGLFTVCSRLKQRQEAMKYLARYRQLKDKVQNVRNEHSLEQDLENLSQSAAKLMLGAELIYSSKHKINQAEQILLKAHKLDPKNIRCLNRLVKLYIARHRYEQAWPLQQELVKLQEQNPQNHLILGFLALHLRRMNQAEQSYRKVIELAPDMVGGYRELAKLYIQTGQQVSKIPALAEKAVELGGTAEDYYILSWAYLQNQQMAEAGQAIRKALDRAPQDERYRQLYDYLQKQERK